MTALAAVVVVALVAAMLCAVLQKVAPAFALAVSLAAAIVVVLRLSAAAQGALRWLLQLGQRVDEQAFASLLRCAGILLLTDYARALCEEAGAESLAWCAGFAGRCLVLAAAWPLLSELCHRIWELTA